MKNKDIAIITPSFNVFYNLTKKDDKLFTNSFWVYRMEVLMGRIFKEYIIAHRAHEIKELDDIIEYLQIRGAKLIYE